MENGRLDGAEMRLDMEDCVIFVRFVETITAGLVRNIKVSHWGQQEHHAHEEQDERQANEHLRFSDTPVASECRPSSWRPRQLSQRV